MHFLKSLVIFTGLILVGLVGIFLVSHFSKSENQANVVNKDCNVEKC